MSKLFKKSEKNQQDRSRRADSEKLFFGYQIRKLLLKISKKSNQFFLKLGCNFFIIIF